MHRGSLMFPRYSLSRESLAAAACPADKVGESIALRAHVTMLGFTPQCVAFETILGVPISSVADEELAWNVVRLHWPLCGVQVLIRVNVHCCVCFDGFRLTARVCPDGGRRRHDNGNVRACGCVPCLMCGREAYLCACM